jgi:hypothetical protein
MLVMRSYIGMIIFKEDKRGEACGMHGGEEKALHSFGRKLRRKETTLNTWAWLGG